MTLADFRLWFEPHLSQTAHDFTNQSKRMPDRDLADLITHTGHIILGDGKRVRPYLCSLMAMKARQASRDVIAIYCALELFHAFCLIHDDIIDHGDKRHGVATLNARHEQFLHHHKRAGDRRHIANAEALLVGDLLISFVFNLLNQYNGTQKRRVLELFYDMAQRVILGQMLDVDTTTRLDVSKDIIEQKMRLKTAEYTFVYPLRIGCVLSNRTGPEVDSFCDTFGTALGLAYQIQDDLLDILPNTKTKKSIFSDIREGQHTLLTYHVLHHGKQAHKKMLQQSWGNQNVDFAVLLRIFHESGAIVFAEKEIEQHLNRAKLALAKIDFAQKTRSELEVLVHYIAKRSS